MRFSAKHGIAITCRLVCHQSVTLVECSHICWKFAKLICFYRVLLDWKGKRSIIASAYAFSISTWCETYCDLLQQRSVPPNDLLFNMIIWRTLVSRQPAACWYLLTQWITQLQFDDSLLHVIIYCYATLQMSKKYWTVSILESFYWDGLCIIINWCLWNAFW